VCALLDADPRDLGRLARGEGGLRGRGDAPDRHQGLHDLGTPRGDRGDLRPRQRIHTTTAAAMTTAASTPEVQRRRLARARVGARMPRLGCRCAAAPQRRCAAAPLRRCAAAPLRRCAAAR